MTNLSYHRSTVLLLSIHFLLGSMNAFAPTSRNHANTYTHVNNQLIQDEQHNAQAIIRQPTLLSARFPWRRSLSSSDDEELSNNHTTNGNTNTNHNQNHNPYDQETEEEMRTRRSRLRQRVNHIAKQMMKPMPKAIASLLSDATLQAVDSAVEEVLQRRNSLPTSTSTSTNGLTTNGLARQDLPPKQNGTQLQYAKDAILSELTLDLVNDAFAPMERSLVEMETSLENAREALQTAKTEASNAIEAIQAAAIAEAMGAASVVESAEEQAERKMIETIYESAQEDDILETLRIEDLEFCDGMAPPFLDESSCLVPGEPVVRVEKAPENSRRIFAGIDILASVDDVWNVLTEYDNLQNVVPNLVVNEVLETYDGHTDQSRVKLDTSKSDPEQCREMAEQMKGALLKQVGGAKVAGINFSARTTLEVREWPQGLPDFAHFNDEVWEGKSRDLRAREYVQTKLERYRFPRPFAISDIPTKDISMQSIPNDDGEFRLYQGVWRMQPLPGCSSPGNYAMRLTYAVEISPRAYLPVQLVEGRIVKDLCANLVAIRDCVTGKVKVEQTA